MVSFLNPGIRSNLIGLFIGFSTMVGTAQAEQVKGIEDATILAPAVMQNTVLVDRKKTIKVCDGGVCIDRESHLVVQVLQLDNGPSTDVSPSSSVYLLMYNDINEHAVAYSMHIIADSMQQGFDAKRVEAGIYEVTLRGFDTSFDGCFDPVQTIRIDARDLSSDVRQGKKTSFFNDAVYTDPIDVSVINADCP